MPHKHNADRRHHIPKMSFKVQNWPAYEAGLHRRGSLTLWIEDVALECWQTTGPNGQARYTGAGVVQGRVTREARLTLPRQMDDGTGFQVWCEDGSKRWRGGEARRR
jgi:hypothetical protein